MTDNTIIADGDGRDEKRRDAHRGETVMGEQVSVPLFRLDDKAALMMGAGSSIGEQIARLCACQGATILVMCLVAPRDVHVCNRRLDRLLYARLRRRTTLFGVWRGRRSTLAPPRMAADEVVTVSSHTGGSAERPVVSTTRRATCLLAAVVDTFVPRVDDTHPAHRGTPHVRAPFAAAGDRTKLPTPSSAVGRALPSPGCLVPHKENG